MQTNPVSNLENLVFQLLLNSQLFMFANKYI